MMGPFLLRAMLDALLATQRQHDRLVEHVEPPSYDTTSMPVELDLPSRQREIVTVASVTVHVTGVKGGFGVGSPALKRWKGLVAIGKVPAELAAQRPADTTDGDWAYVLALLERYSRCAYHRIVSRRVGIVVNHPLGLRTSHGNGGNVGAGFSIDAGNAETLSPAFVKAAQDGLEDLIIDCHEASGETIVVVPHRCYSGDRRVDTDMFVWSEVVRPVVDRLTEDFLDVCRIDYELAEGSGRPIPISWDDRALFDDRGRRLAA